MTVIDENKNSLYTQVCPRCESKKDQIRRLQEELRQLRALSVLKGSQ